MPFPNDVLAVRVELLLGGEWTDITAWVRADAGVAISRGRRNEATDVEPGTCALTLDNRGGAFAWRNPESPWYGLLGRNTPMRVSVLSDSGTRHWRFHGEVAEWPPRWTHGGDDVWLPITAAGLLRRLSTSTPPARDSIRHYVAAQQPLAYWPLTDGESASHGTEVAGGGQPVRTLGPDGSYYSGKAGWAQGALAAHLEQVVGLEGVGQLTTTTRLDAAPGGWSVDHCRSGVGDEERFEIRDIGEGNAGDPRVVWAVVLDPVARTAALRVEVRETSGSSSTTTLGTATIPLLFSPRPHHLRVQVAPAANPAQTAWSLWVDGVQVLTGTWAAVGHRPVGGLTMRWTYADDLSEAARASTGHWALWGADAPDPIDVYRALTGWARETAGRRVARMCELVGLPLRVHGALDASPVVGAQRPGTVLDVLRAAAEVDDGTLGEARDALALEYRTGRSRYNQEVQA